MRRVLALAVSAAALTLLATASLGTPTAQAVGAYDISLGSSTSTAVPLDDVTFSGQVRGADGDPAAGTVKLQLRLQGTDSWWTWKSAATAAGGSYTITATLKTPNRDWEVRALMPGDSVNATGYSAIQRVTVGRGAYDVTLGLSKSTAFVNDYVTFRGRVHTASGKDASGTAIIQIRPASGGSWVDWKTDKLNSYGVFSKRVRVTSANRVWEVRAKMPESSANVAGYSPVGRLTVTGPTATEAKVISLVNKERTKRGLRPVRVRWDLTRAARYHSRDMARRNGLTHYSSNGYSVGKRLRYFGYTSSGYRYWTAGENIARGKTGTLYATPEAIVASWMRSYGHRKVILRSVFRDVGVGTRTSTSGYVYFTLDMGRRVR